MSKLDQILGVEWTLLKSDSERKQAVKELFKDVVNEVDNLSLSVAEDVIEATLYRIEEL